MNLPRSGVTLGARLFRYCYSLRTATLPEGIAELPYQCFWDCRVMMNIVIPEGIAAIPNGAFYNCERLTSVILPDSLTTIGKNAFHACARLESLRLSANVTEIDETAFSDCILLAITAPEGSVAAQYALDHHLIPENVVLESAHPYVTGEWTYTHPESAAGMLVTFSARTEISQYFAEDCLSIRDAKGREKGYIGDDLAGESLLLPGNTFTLTLEGFSSGEHYGFRITEVRGLTQAEYDEQLAKMLAHPWVTHVVDGTLEITGYKGFETDLTIPAHINNASVASIGENAFAGNRTLTRVTIEEGLTTVNLPQGLTDIGICAFSECSALLSIHLPDSVTMIGEKAFDQCSNLAEIALPEGLKSIEAEAFTKSGVILLSG